MSEEACEFVDHPATSRRGPAPLPPTRVAWRARSGSLHKLSLRSLRQDKLNPRQYKLSLRQYS